MDSFWLVEALIDGWGLGDAEVASALQDFALATNVEDDWLAIQCFGCHFLASSVGEGF